MHSRKTNRTVIPTVVAVVGLLLAASSCSAQDTFGQANDLSSYLASPQASASPGDQEANQALALQECGILLARPNYAQEQATFFHSMNDKNASYKDVAAKRMNERCAAFAKQTGYKTHDISRLFLESSKKGSVKGNAYELASTLRSGSTNHQSAVAGVSTILATKDPVATAILAQSFEQGGPFSETQGGEVASRVSGFAWALVACDEGLECGPKSRLVYSACMEQNICGPGDYEANLERSISDEDFKKAVAASKSIEAAIANGTIQKLINFK